MNVTIIEAIISGGVVSILVALLLATLSLASLGIIFTEIIALLRDRRTLADFYRELQNGKTPSGEAESSWQVIVDQHAHIADKPSDLRRIRVATIKATVADKGSHRLAFLASIGANAPFIGLFGTVMGVMRALENIRVATTVTPADIGPPVGEALVMTAFGLVVAVPAVIGYNLLTEARKRRIAHIDRILRHLEHQTKNEAINLDRGAMDLIKAADERVAKKTDRLRPVLEPVAS